MEKQKRTISLILCTDINYGYCKNVRSINGIETNIPWNINIDREHLRKISKNKQIYASETVYNECKKWYPNIIPLKRINGKFEDIKLVNKDIIVWGGYHVWHYFLDNYYIDKIYLNKIIKDYKCTYNIMDLMNKYELTYKYLWEKNIYKTQDSNNKTSIKIIFEIYTSCNKLDI